MAQLGDAQLAAAAERGRVLQASEPRATAARYDPERGLVIVELTNGCLFGFPARAVQGLEAATDDELAGVEILGAGYGLHWDALDVDLSVPGVLAEIFGTRAYMARRAGQAVSARKAAAARVNGRKGGRPRKATATAE